MKCPKCGAELVEVDPFEIDVFGGSGIYGCPRCCRLWLFEVREVSSNSEFLRGRTQLNPQTNRIHSQILLLSGNEGKIPRDHETNSWLRMKRGGVLKGEVS